MIAQVTAYRSLQERGGDTPDTKGILLIMAIIGPGEKHPARHQWQKEAFEGDAAQERGRCTR